MKFFEAKQWNGIPFRLVIFDKEPFGFVFDSTFINLPEWKMPSFFFHEKRNFSHSTTGRFGRRSSKMEITGNTEMMEELFALIKKLCVNGIQKPSTEFQFHFMFILLFGVDSPTCKPITIPIKELNKSQMRNIHRCLHTMNELCGGNISNITHGLQLRQRWKSRALFLHPHACK